jgi:hypothetical protein
MKAAAKAAVLNEADVPADSVTAYRFKDNYVVEFYCGKERLYVSCHESFALTVRESSLAHAVTSLARETIRKYRDYLELRPQ